MKAFTYPEPVTVGTNLTLTYGQFVEHILETAPRFNKSGAGIRQGTKIDRAHKDAGEPGQLVILEDADYEVWKAEVENPEAGYPMLLRDNGGGRMVSIHAGRQLLPYIDAVASATAYTPPREDKPRADANGTEQARKA